MDPNAQQDECIDIICRNLPELVMSTMVLNNRSIEHKCSKLILAALDGAQNLIHTDVCIKFETALKHANVEAIPSMTQCDHAGALR